MGLTIMCCRYWFDESPELRPFVEAMNRSPLMERFSGGAEIVTSGEVRPTNVAPVIASDKQGRRAVYPMKWGFSGKSLLINARTESAAAKPTFKEAWQAHRCIVPASAYFEWVHMTDSRGRKRTGPKYRIQPAEGQLWMCGLYRVENGLPAFVILTRDAAESLRFIHDRMPLMLPEPYVGEWIRPDATPETLLDFAQTEMTYASETPALC